MERSLPSRQVEIGGSAEGVEVPDALGSQEGAALVPDGREGEPHVEPPELGLGPFWRVPE